MKSAAWWMGLVAVVLFTGCGDPINPPPEEDGGTQTDGGDCPPTECVPPPAQTSLWPMTTGSRWTYDIDDPLKGKWVKVVHVEGTQKVPGTDVDAILFVSEQPHLVERSWQIEEGGLAKRLREEDLDPASGQLKRITTWTPSTIKALTTQKDAGWESRANVTERVDNRETGEVDEKVKEFIWRVVEVDVPVTVAGQQYKAIKVVRDREDKEGRARTYWFVPGIGKVREESADRTEVLTQVEIKQP